MIRPIRAPVASSRAPQVAMPIGGIATGSISMNAYGGFQDFAIRHRPSITARPDGFAATDAFFATLRVPGSDAPALLVEGPVPRQKIYDQGLKSQGFRQGGYEGLPRFARARFSASYPFGVVELADPDVPLAVSVTAWNPFIPLDDVASGMPCAIVEYRLVNRGRRRARFELGVHASHLAPGSHGGHQRSRTRALPGEGVRFLNVDDAGSETYGSAALVAVRGPKPRIKAQWFRGGWFDGISALWREVEGGVFRENDGVDGDDIDGRNGGSLLFAGEIAAGGEATCVAVLAWHFPNSDMRHGYPTPPAGAAPACDPAGGCCPVKAPAWRPFYAGRWHDAVAVARDAAARYDELRARTSAFVDALARTTAPAPIIDAASANLAIIKSPTILRQENGNVWGWEGCFTDAGCCHGSCTHVWNYAQALPHLFPALERTLREQEYRRSLDERGHVTFRSALPDGPTDHGFHAAADGQLGGLVKLWRDWQIGGDDAWLRELWPLAKRSLEFCIRSWDPNRSGALVEPHHNTYDIEFWGPDGMCGSVYVAALAAAAELARACGDADADGYAALAAKAAKQLGTLFNGEYHAQKVRWKDLRDRGCVDLVARGGPTAALVAKEGPKYQYGTGCLADGVIGAWMARAAGLDAPFDRERIRANLRAIHRHNLVGDLRRHACVQRPGYATGDEGGLLLCTWPRGGKPTLPFPYSDEVWTGIEYQVASHCIAEGLVREGVEIVATARARYDGVTRNPFDEYECGSFYARAMASWSLINAWAGFRYSAVTRTLELAPKTSRRPFRTVLSTTRGWGSLTLTRSRLDISLVDGELPIERVVVDGRAIDWSTTARAGEPARLSLARAKRR